MDLEHWIALYDKDFRSIYLAPKDMWSKIIYENKRYKDYPHVSKILSKIEESPQTFSTSN